MNAKILWIVILITITPCLHAQLPVVNGWTLFAPSPDSRIIYVSQSSGNDGTAVWYSPSDTEVGADPFHPAGSVQPYQTLAAAVAELRTGYPDWILLLKGDTFVDQHFGTLNLSGKNINEPILVGSYGTEEQRPTILTGNQGLISFFGSAAYIAITGLHAVPHTRAASDEPVAVNILNAPFRSFLVEDCYFDSFSSHIIVQDYSGSPSYTHTGFTARRNVLVNGYKTGGNSSGVFMHRVDSILFEENLFDHNGWHESIAGAGANAFSHNTYFHPSCGVLDFRKNIVTRASAAGIGARCGGTIFDNLMIENPRNMIVGSFDPSQINWPAEGSSGEIFFNVILGSRVESFDAGNGMTVERGRNVQIHHNIMAHFTMLSNYNAALQLNNVEDIDVRKNIVYKWGNNQSSGIEFSSGISIGTSTLGLVQVDSNDVQMENHQGHCMNTNGSFTNLQFRGNRYHNVSAPNNWFDTGNYSTWLTNSGETNSTQLDVPYTDPERNITTYLSSIGETGDLETFIDLRKEMSKDHWDEAFTATVVNDYIREGFNMQPLASVTEVAGPGKIFVYPNPATETIYIPALDPEDFYTISDLNGKVQKTGYGNVIAIYFLSPGIYFLATPYGPVKFIRL